MTIREAISTALQAIIPEQVHHPELRFQERVVCYELYHQLRLLEENKVLKIRPARIQAEVNKRGQERFLQAVAIAYLADGDELDWRVPEAMPDMLVHEPGKDRHNLAAIEVKRWGASDLELRRDLAKLAFFAAKPLNYAERIFIVINELGAPSEHVIGSLSRLATTEGADIAVGIYDPLKQTVEWSMLKFDFSEAVKFFQEIAAAAVKRRNKRA